MAKFYLNHLYYAFSDLHGQGKYYDYIMQLLEDEQAKPENRFKKVTVIIIGDIVDRGPDSIRMLIDVMRRVKRQKGKIEVIMTAGNHEWMMYQAIKYYFEYGYGCDDIKSKSGIWFAVDNHGRYTFEDFTKLDFNLQKELFEFLGSLPLCYTLHSSLSGYETYGFIHAVPFKNILTISDEEIPTIKRMDEESRYRDLSICLTDHLYDEHIKDLVAVSGGTVVVGHEPVDYKGGFKILEDKNIICIDGGCGSIASKPDGTLSGVATLFKVFPSPDKSKVKKSSISGKGEVEEDDRFIKIDKHELRQAGPHYLSELERLGKGKRHGG